MRGVAAGSTKETCRRRRRSPPKTRNNTGRTSEGSFSSFSHYLGISFRTRGGPRLTRARRRASTLRRRSGASEIAAPGGRITGRVPEIRRTLRPLGTAGFEPADSCP